MSSCWCKGRCPNIALPRRLISEGRDPQAHAALRKVLSAAPNCAEANIALVNILCRSNHHAEAEIHLARAAQAEGQSIRVLLGSAEILRGLGRMEEALAAYKAAGDRAKDDDRLEAVPTALAGMAFTLEMMGRAKDGRVLIDESLAAWPDHAGIRRNAAVIYDATGDSERAIEILSAGPMQPIHYLDRGRFRDKLGQYAEAWADWMEGKRRLREQQHFYNWRHFQSMFADLAAAGTEKRLALASPAAGDFDGPQPIFVTGFPRSGTTMIETVVSSHPRVMAGDELMGVPQAINALPLFSRAPGPYPGAMMALSLGENASTATLLRDLYCLKAKEKLGWRRPAALFFTDKMPFNEIHLPFIRLLFPKALMIHVRRHPLDVLVSCMSHFLVSGGFYASSLEACATHYAAVDSLMEHYRKKLPAQYFENVLAVKYEDFVLDPAAKVAEIAGAMGLKPTKGMVEFHKNPRHSKTISYKQVKQPLYDKSIGRWKNYREQLAPAIGILKPILEREGYEY